MSGQDEKPHRTPEFPRCLNCGHKVWTKGYEGFEYVNIGDEWDEDEVYKWSDDEIGYTGESTPWKCNSCGESARIYQIPIIDEFLANAEWIY